MPGARWMPTASSKPRRAAGGAGAWVEGARRVEPGRVMTEGGQGGSKEPTGLSSMPPNTWRRCGRELGRAGKPGPTLVGEPGHVLVHGLGPAAPHAVEGATWSANVQGGMRAHLVQAASRCRECRGAEGARAAALAASLTPQSLTFDILQDKTTHLLKPFWPPVPVGWCKSMWIPGMPKMCRQMGITRAFGSGAVVGATPAQTLANPSPGSFCPHPSSLKAQALGGLAAPSSSVGKLGASPAFDMVASAAG